MDFFQRNLPTHGFSQVVFASGPFEDTLVNCIGMQQWNQLHTEGDELLGLAWKYSQQHSIGAECLTNEGLYRQCWALSYV